MKEFTPKKKFIKTLRELKELSNHPAYRMSSIIVNKNRIIAKGYNKNKTHPKSNHPFSFIHAEFAAIYSINKSVDLRGCDIYIYREKRNGDLGCSLPCEFCLELIRDVGISYVIYINNNRYIKDNISEIKR